MTKYIVRNALVATDLGAEKAILNVENGVYYGLNEVGRWVWEQLQEPVDLETLRDRMTAEYEVDAETAEQDLRALLEQLVKESLIVAEGTDE